MLFGSLARDRDFLKLWGGQAISKIGSTITSVGIPLTAASVLGASPLQMGILAGANGAGVLLFGLFAGAWADRLRRRPTMICADLVRAALLGTIPLAAVLHRLNMAHLYAVTTLAGIVTVLFDVSYQAYLPTLVKRAELVDANSKLALTESIADVTGPGLTGLLVQTATAPLAILLDALSFLCSAVSVWMIHKPEPRPEPAAAPDIRREIAEGLRASWRDRRLRALLARSGTGAFFAGTFGSLYYIFAVRELRLSALLLGAVISAGGASNLVGALVAERLQNRLGLGRALIGAAWMIGLAMLLVPLAHGTVAVSCAFLIAAQLGDMAWPIYTINATSLRQAVTPGHLLGRVNSADHLLFWGALPLGALAGGAVAETLGIRQTLLLGTLGYALSTLWFTFSPIRRVRELPPAESASAATG